MIRSRSTTTRDRNLQFRGIFSNWIFLNSLQWICFLLLQVLCVTCKEIAPKCGGIACFPRRRESVESCHVSGCHGFFGPEMKLHQSTLSQSSAGSIFHAMQSFWPQNALKRQKMPEINTSITQLLHALSFVL